MILLVMVLSLMVLLALVSVTLFSDDEGTE
jgi:hypothetical protein